MTFHCLGRVFFDTLFKSKKLGYEEYEKKKSFVFWFSPILEHFDRFLCFYFLNAKFIEKQSF